MNFKLQIIWHLALIKLNRLLYKNRLDFLQERKWLKMKAVLKSSPFYASYVDKKLQHSDFPLMNKKIFMENFNLINTKGIKLVEAMEVAFAAENSRDFAPMIDCITIGLSSGTSGNRAIFLANERERAIWVAAILDRVTGVTLKKRSVAFFLRANSNLYNSVKSKLLNFAFFDLMLPISEHIERLNHLTPEILVAQPSMMLELAKLKENGTLKIHPSKVITIAEVLYPEDHEYLQRVFGQIIHQVYQCTEGFLAATCKYGVLHFNEDFLIIEKKYIDDEKQRFHPVITDLMRTTQPVVRYELNDILHEKRNCRCGNKMLAVSEIEGRSDDILVFRSKNNERIQIFPDFFRKAIIMADESIQDYFLVQTTEKSLSLFIGGGMTLYDKSKKSIMDLLECYDVTNTEIVRIDNKIHKQENKFRRIQNASKQTN